MSAERTEDKGHGRPRMVEMTKFRQTVGFLPPEIHSEDHPSRRYGLASEDANPPRLDPPTQSGGGRGDKVAVEQGQFGPVIADKTASERHELERKGGFART